MIRFCLAGTRVCRRCLDLEDTRGREKAGWNIPANGEGHLRVSHPHGEAGGGPDSGLAGWQQRGPAARTASSGLGQAQRLCCSLARVGTGWLSVEQLGCLRALLLLPGALQG